MTWHFNPDEPRNLHGEWVHGVGAVKEVTSHLVKEGKINQKQANDAVRVAEKRATEANMTALKGEHTMAEHLKHMSSGLRMAAVKANKDKLPKVAQLRRKQARAVEAVHAALTGQKTVAKAPTSAPAAPNAPSAPKPSAPKKPREIKLRERDLAMVNKGAVTEAFGSSHYGKPKFNWWSQVEGAYKGRYEKDLNYADLGEVLKGLRAWQDKYKPYATEEFFTNKYNSIPATVEKLSAARLKLKQATTGVKKTSTVTEGGVTVKTTTKLTRVKVAGAALKPGDILVFGGIKGRSQYRVLDNQPEGGITRLKVEHLTGVKAYGVSEEGDLQIGAKDVLTVKRPLAHKKVSGSVDLTAAPTADSFHQALSEALAKGHNLAELDPSKRPMGAGQTPGHVQQLLYDLAVGKVKRGDKTETKVKSDEEYRKQLEASGELSSLADQADKSVDWGFTKPGGGYLRVPGNTPHEELLKLAAAHNSQGQWEQYVKGLADQGTLTSDTSKTYRDFAKSLDLKNFDKAVLEGALNYFRLRRKADVEKKTTELVNGRISELRQQEGTASFAYDIPHFDDVEMKPQTFSDIEAEMSKTEGKYVPSFYNASMLEDGVLYHRAGGLGETPPIDSSKLGTAMATDLAKYGPKNPANGLTPVQIATALIGTLPGTTTEHEQLTQHLDYQFTHNYMLSTFTPAERTQIQEVVNKTVAKVERARQRAAANAPGVTSGRGSQEGDSALVEALKNSGTRVTVNSKNIDPGYKGSGSIYPGSMLLLEEGGAADPEALDRARKKLLSHQYSSLSAFQPAKLPAFGDERQAALDKAKNGVADFRARVLDANTPEALHELANELATTRLLGSHYFDVMTKKMQRQITRDVKNNLPELHDLINSEMNSRVGATRRIEYVPHEQPKEGAPSSQRGRLTLEGYTPEEAVQKLQELGIVGQLEPQVPYSSVMNGPRRSGLVVPMHPAYIRGDAEPPRSPVLITHGITGKKGGDMLTTVKSILHGGGLMSIAERYRNGIKVLTSSPAGDIRSGIDHVVFCALDSGGTCGSGSGVRIGLRPEALMRRDVVLAPRDFGGMGTRYGHYKTYRDELEAEAGGESGLNSLYAPLAPAARQIHLDNKAKSPGSSEYNVAGQVSVEDMHVISVPTQEMREQVHDILQEMMKNGEVKRVPTVVVGNDAFKEATHLTGEATPGAKSPFVAGSSAGLSSGLPHAVDSNPEMQVAQALNLASLKNKSFAGTQPEHVKNLTVTNFAPTEKHLDATVMGMPTKVVLKKDQPNHTWKVHTVSVGGVIPILNGAWHD